MTFGNYDVIVQAMDGMRVSKVRFVKQRVEAGRHGSDGSQPDV
ncbi:MAG: hypothetical protein HZC41_19675 [Chloroflexi bacterium]|nr:hypothetical protein [Chloroflexota bacterium]